jgi:hypothetical protein
MGAKARIEVSGWRERDTGNPLARLALEAEQAEERYAQACRDERERDDDVEDR